MKQNQITIPKYVVDGNLNIPEDLKKVLDYFRECANQKYQLCLVGEKESVAKDLKGIGYQGKEFLHLDNKGLDDNYPFFPVSIKNSIRRLNLLVSNPENDFNQNPKLGIHSIGLVPKIEIKDLNDLGYGLTSWNGVQVFSDTCGTWLSVKCW